MSDSSNAGCVGCLVAVAVIGGLGWFGYGIVLGQQVRGEWLLWRDCPFGTELAGKHPPDGTEQWCQERDEQGGYRRHGPAFEWYASGQIKTNGSYVHGKKEGSWPTWDEQGERTRGPAGRTATGGLNASHDAGGASEHVDIGTIQQYATDAETAFSAGNLKAAATSLEIARYLLQSNPAVGTTQERTTTIFRINAVQTMLDKASPERAGPAR